MMWIQAVLYLFGSLCENRERRGRILNFFVVSYEIQDGDFHSG